MLGKDTFLYERLELAMTRIQAIGEEQLTVQDAEFPWENYFIQVSAWMKDVYRFIEENEDGKTKDWCMLLPPSATPPSCLPDTMQIVRFG